MKQQLLPIWLYTQIGCNVKHTLDRMIAMEKWAVIETLIQHQHTWNHCITIFSNYLLLQNVQTTLILYRHVYHIDLSTMSYNYLIWRAGCHHEFRFCFPAKLWLLQKLIHVLAASPSEIHPALCSTNACWLATRG